MSDTLAERLADRLDIQPEQTDRLVRTLARLIKTQAARDGQVRVPGLGIFEQQADTLSFEPDPHFAETVNPKYAHLPTVSVALPVSDSFSPNEPEPVVEEDAPEAQGDTTPTVEADDVALPAFPPPPAEPEDVAEEEIPKEEEVPTEEESLPASFLDEEEPAATDTSDTTAYDITPPPLPPDEVEQDIFESSTEEEEPAIADEDVSFEDQETADDPVVDDEGSPVDEPDFEAVSDAEVDAAFTDEPPLEDHADEEDEAFIASLLADETEDMNDEEDSFREDPFDWKDHEEDAFDDTEPLEDDDDLYDTLEEESSSFEEDTFLEEGEPSAWAPPGTRWTGENKDQLVPIEEDETEGATASLSPFSLEDTESDDSAFAPSPLTAVPKAALEKPSTEGDLPPRPPARIQQHQQDAQPSGNSIWPWLLVALLFVVVAGGAYYYFNLREQPIATNEPPPTEQPTNTDDPATTSPTEEEPLTQDPSTETDDATDTEATGQPEDEEPPPGEETPAEPPAASTGAIDRAQGGYTLVVGSRESREAAVAGAERVRQTLNDDAIPVDVLQGTVNGTTRYRIGVGQVETTDAALALKQRLGNRIPADAWVTRILPDS